MSRTCYRAEIEAAARAHGLDPNLVEAVVFIESSGYTNAFRPEPAFFQKYQAPKPEWAFAITNPHRYGSSYGLMQVMFCVATEVGMPITDPPEHLFVPEVGLDVGCRKLAELIGWSKRKGATMTDEVQLRSALAAFNGGHLKNEPDFAPDRNAAYADKVWKVFVRPR